MGIPVNEYASEALAVLGQLAPVSQGAGAASISGITMAKGTKLLFVLQIATLSGGSTVDAKIQTCATSGGSYADLAGGAITQVTSGTNPIIMIEVRAETLAAAGVGPFVKLLITVGTAAAVIAAVAYAASTHYSPASDSNIANVAQTIVV
jgi:hypothetical protein